MKRVLLLLFCVGMTIGVWAQNKKSSSIVNIGGVSFYVHTVLHGQTVYSLSKLYEVAQDSILKYNPLAADGIAENAVLKIPFEAVSATANLSKRKQTKLFEEHIVNQGETAYSIAKRYGLSVALLVEDNPGVEITTLSIGTKLHIRKSGIGDSKDAEIKEELEVYKEALNSVSAGFKYHVVEKGDTFYNLSKKYEVGQHELMRINDIATNDGLKLGAMIKIPVPVVVAVVPDADIPTNIERESETSVALDMKRMGGEPLKMSVLLPLNDSKSSINFLEFYQGALMALEDIKSEGNNVDVNVYNTQRSTQHTAEIITNPDFARSDLIIGPVYEDGAEQIVRFAEQNRIPVVSPLAAFDNVSSGVLFQLSPDNANKYDKLKQLFTPDKNIIVISSATNDSELERELSAILPSGAHKLSYSKATPPQSIEQKLSGDRENVIVVLANNEINVDEILARLSSIQNNMLARSIPVGKISVVGSSRWMRFNNIDKNLFFKLNLHFVSSYYADRSSERVAKFDRRYVTAFNALPSLYSYRGYDAVKLFVGTLCGSGEGSLSYNLNNYNKALLSMPYSFRDGNGATNKNDQWALVRYNNNYTVEIR